ncbi:MAG: transpeptidase family protein [Bacteroidetes bacterium]|nr:transpeptidase family protein [Bacteroidota bacterium]
MTIKNEVLIRMYTVLVFVVVFALFIFVRAIRISVTEGEIWRERGKEKYVQVRSIEADRGNILAADGSLLATSLPFFDIAFDPNSSGMAPGDFDKHIDSLAYCISTFVDPSLTEGAYKDYLDSLREAGKQYVRIKSNASFEEMLKIQEFPLFNQGQYRGGFIATPKYRRDRPFGLLAHRTIGYVREGSKPVGLEGYFDETLAGEAGQQLMIRVDDGLWKPINDLAKIEPRSGKDIVTTIDVDLQDITEQALYSAVLDHEADHGVAILMEVETGAIRAIANIGKTRDGDLWETYNHAVGSATEPGSTFKLASIMALLEGGYVNLEDSLDLEKGKTAFYEETMLDASAHMLDSTSVRRAFEISSNVGIAKLVQQHFGDGEKAEEYVNLIRSFHLDQPTGIEIQGEAIPYVKEPYSQDDSWSGTTLPWMSIGYEVMITPLQLLAFYNAVANGGIMVKPYLVSEVQEYGQTLEQFPIQVLSKKIASKKTIAQARELLEGVVLNGTARGYRTEKYNFAGKTGTAQLNYQRLKDRTRVGGYQASFAGYFPAENPKYSCIVLISNPRKGGIYGSDVALPVFRGIADNVFLSRPDMFPVLNDMPKGVLASNKMPDQDVGRWSDFEQALTALNVPYDPGSPAEFGVLLTDSVSLNIERRTIPEDRVPNVVGMGLRDALYILENRGLKVEVSGYGKVRQQSIKPGTRLRGQTIRLRLG